MTMDLYLSTVTMATLPNMGTLFTIVAIMVLGGVALNLISWLYNEMAEAEMRFDNVTAKIDAILATHLMQADALLMVDHLYARMGKPVYAVGEIPAYMADWPEWEMPLQDDGDLEFIGIMDELDFLDAQDEQPLSVKVLMVDPTDVSPSMLAPKIYMGGNSWRWNYEVTGRRGFCKAPASFLP